MASYQIPKTGEWTFVGTLYLVCLVNGLLVIVVAILVTSLVTVQPQDPLAEAYLLDMFRQRDRNNSGTLDANDTRRLLHDIGLPNLQVDKAMSRLDFDQDGSLSRAAWLRVADFLIFDHKAQRAISRFHNRLTGALIRWGLRYARVCIGLFLIMNRSLLPCVGLFCHVYRSFLTFTPYINLHALAHISGRSAKTGTRWSGSIYVYILTYT